MRTRILNLIQHAKAVLADSEGSESLDTENAVNILRELVTLVDEKETNCTHTVIQSKRGKLTCLDCFKPVVIEYRESSAIEYREGTADVKVKKNSAPHQLKLATGGES